MALHRSKLPKVDLLEGESGQLEDFEVVSGDMVDAVPLQINSIPIGVTVLKVYVV